jgi:hypothetical protein
MKVDEFEFWLADDDEVQSDQIYVHGRDEEKRKEKERLL